MKEKAMHKISILMVASLLFGFGLKLNIDSAAAGPGSHHHPPSVQLQEEIERQLVGCYVVGADLVGAGDVEEAKRVLSECFADNLITKTVMPPAYEQLSLNTQGGGAAWADASHAFYQTLGVVRTQHILSNVVIRPTGRDALRVTSSALAIHVFPDEHTFNATVKFDDVFRREKGSWKVEHRVMTVTSLTESEAWSF